MRFAQRLEQLEKRKRSHHYIPGTKAFDEAIEAFFYRTKARCSCESCLQYDVTGDNTACIPGCPTWQEAETDEASMLDTSDMLQRILYERITAQK